MASQAGHGSGEARRALAHNHVDGFDVLEEEKQMEKRNMLSRREALRIAGSIAMALPVMGLFGCAGTSRSGDADAPSAGTESSVADTTPSDQTASASTGSASCR